MNEKARIGRRVSTHTMLLNGLLVAIKLIVGLLSGSSVLIADAFHSLTDILSTMFVYFGITISNKPADEEHPFGHEKAELIVSKIIAIILMITAVGITYGAINGIKNEVVHTPGVFALIVVFVSIGLNEFMYFYCVRTGEKIGSQSLIADGWHHRTDSLSSVAALVGVVGSMFGFSILDPIAAIVVALIIARAGLKIYYQSIKELMDTAPSKQIIDLIRHLLTDDESVLEIDSLKAIFHLNHIDIYTNLKVENTLTIEEGYLLINELKNKIIKRIDNIQDINVYLIPIREDN
ncbi:cation transporter [Mycoplasmatota bacterium]|nr:cation transporter [Mycoplasmatota bacterium]